MKICVLGAGAYGIALALAFNKNSSNDITIWTKLEDEYNLLVEQRQNKKALPGVLIDENIKISNNLDCLNACNLVVFAIPINFLEDTTSSIKPYINPNMHFCIATKGIDKNGKLPLEIIENILKTNNILFLAGGSFAKDLANNSKTGLSLACKNNKTYNLVYNALKSDILNIDRLNDVIGAQICSILKNIYAIMAGMLDAIEVSDTTKSLFLTLVIKEMQIIITKLKGKSASIISFAGIGDTILTCNSKNSRNYSLGTILVKNKDNLDDYLKNNTVEGYYSLIYISKLLDKHHINPPLIRAIYDILFNDKDPNYLIDILTK